MTEYDIELGKKYVDSITGFEGIATARFEYLYGCTRINLTGVINGEPKDFNFDAPQLKEVGSNEEITSARTGGPGVAPAPRPTGQ